MFQRTRVPLFAAAEKKSIGAPPPPVKITGRAAAEILTSAQGSS